MANWISSVGEDGEARKQFFKPENHARIIQRAHYYPGGSEILIELIAEKSTGRILGAGAAGKEGVSKRIYIIATAITAGMSIGELTSLDLSYAPPFAPVWDPVLVAANDFKKKME
ncbi:MAG: hypothetical protein FIB08_10455 [Candidatus Methanoperedens sp.]|nr:hypothetical protein [Candidatus Methanoperedens sp.]